MGFYNDSDIAAQEALAQQMRALYPSQFGDIQRAGRAQYMADGMTPQMANRAWANSPDGKAYQAQVDAWYQTPEGRQYQQLSQAGQAKQAQMESQTGGGSWLENRLEDGTDFWGKYGTPITAALMTAGIGSAISGAAGASGIAGSLGASSPTAVGAINGALGGAGAGGAISAVTGNDVGKGILGGALGGGIAGGVSGFNPAAQVGIENPTLGGAFNNAVKSGLSAAAGGRNPLAAAVTGGLNSGLNSILNTAGSYLDSVFSSPAAPATSTGANMGLGDDWFSNWNPDSLSFTTDIAGNVLPVELPSFSSGGVWNPQIADFVSDWGANTLGRGDSGGGWGGAIGGALKNLLGGASSAVGGGGNLAALIGAGLGAASGGGTNTATTQSQIDPRMAQYLYGTGYGDKNSLLGAAQDWFQQNKTGMNPTMQQGIDMQKAALTDPNYGQAYQQMRNAGMGLLSSGVAANPFTAQAPTMSQAGGSGGLLSPQDRMKALMTRGQGLIG